MKKIIFLVLIPFAISAQKFAVEKSTIVFFSDAIVEDIKATNTKTNALMEISSGEIAFDVPIKNFEFEKDLMKQHFNEKYMETEKFPKAQFSGKLIDFNKSKSGVQQLLAEGKMNIHGVVKEMKIPGTMEVMSDGKIWIKAKFMVKLKDHKIKIPTVVWQNIAEEVEVSVEFLMQPK